MPSASLRRWFVIHFLVDLVFAIPLILAPGLLLGFLGWTAVDPVTARLVGAALFGIGVESYLGRDAGVDVYRGMLRLKIMWSMAANVGLAISIAEGAPAFAVVLLAIFGAFSALWIYHYRKL